MNDDRSAVELVREWLARRDPRWVLGAIGAIAEFEPDDAHEVAPGGLRARGLHGAIGVLDHPDMRALAYELPSAEQRAWLHGVALCLPEELARGAARKTITELGPDRDAIRAGDASQALFDLGIGSPWCEMCVRSDDPALLRALRAALGCGLLDPGHDLLEAIAAASPTRVFVSRLARVEVWQRIPRRDEHSPQGSHTHFLPRLLRPARTVSAAVPVPRGWVACLGLLPPNPLRDALGRDKPADRAQFDAFQGLLERHGAPDYLSAKRAWLARAAAGPALARGTSRVARLAALVASRQHAVFASPGLPERAAQG